MASNINEYRIVINGYEIKFSTADVDLLDQEDRFSEHNKTRIGADHFLVLLAEKVCKTFEADRIKKELWKLPNFREVRSSLSRRASIMREVHGARWVRRLQQELEGGNTTLEYLGGHSSNGSRWGPDLVSRYPDDDE